MNIRQHGALQDGLAGAGGSCGGDGVVGLIRSQISALGKVLSWNSDGGWQQSEGGQRSVEAAASLLSVMVRGKPSLLDAIILSLNSADVSLVLARVFSMKPCGPSLPPAYLLAQVKDSGQHIFAWLKDQLRAVQPPCTGSSLTPDGSGAVTAWPGVKAVFKFKCHAEECPPDGLGAWELQLPAFSVVCHMLEAILVRNCGRRYRCWRPFIQVM